MSTIGSAFAIAAILLQISVVALGILNMEAILAPATAMIHHLMVDIPNINVTGIFLSVAWLEVRFVVIGTPGVLEGMHVIMPARTNRHASLVQ